MGDIPISSHNHTNDKQPAGSNLSSAARFDANQHVENLIEQLKQRTAELEEVNRELRRVSHYHSLFLTRMSHELRTPLTSILGFSEILLEQERLTESQMRFCQKIQDSGIQLQTSLNRLVDLSRLESGATQLFLQEFSLRETLCELCAALASVAQRNHVILEYDLAANIDPVVFDQAKLRQILYNFLAWALSRSKPGEKVSLHADLIDSAFLRIRIDDCGDPILDLERVFNLEEASGSSGANIDELGIIIGRRLLDVMKGNVRLENRGARGLSVMIQLPARPPKG